MLTKENEQLFNDALIKLSDTIDTIHKLNKNSVLTDSQAVLCLEKINYIENFITQIKGKKENSMGGQKINQSLVECPILKFIQQEKHFDFFNFDFWGRGIINSSKSMELCFIHILLCCITDWDFKIS